MKMTEIRKLPTSDLTNQSVKIKEEIVELKRQLILGESTNSRAIRNKRRELARVLTVLSEQLIKETK